MSPLRGAGLLCCASSRSRLADGRPSLTRARHHPPCSLARRVVPDGGPRGPCRCARQGSDQGCAFIAMHNTMVRPAMPAEMTTAARSRARGSRALFPSRVRDRGPLDELTGLPLTPLRSVRCTPAGSSPRSPAMPDARAAECLEVIGPAPQRPPRQSLRLVSGRSQRCRTSDPTLTVPGHMGPVLARRACVSS